MFESNYVDMSKSNRTIKCSNMSMYEKMSQLTAMIARSYDIVDSSIHAFPDMAVVAEMMMMAAVSKKCGHGVHSKKPTKTFERADPLKTPSYIEEMNVHSTVGMCSKLDNSARSNAVTSMIISDCISIFEYMQRYDSLETDEGRIILTDVSSVTHAATVAYVFEIVSAIQGWDGDVSLLMLTTEDMRIAMSVYVDVRTNVYVETCNDPAMMLSKLLATNTRTYTTVITHIPTCKRLIMSTNRQANVDVNMLISLDTISKEREIRSYCANESMLMEMCPCSNISSNVVRVVPEHKVTDLLTSRLMYRDTSRSAFSKVSWYSNMIRSMSVGSMCYDCSLASMFAKSMALALTGQAMNEDEDEDADWRAHYSRRLEPQQDVD